MISFTDELSQKNRSNFNGSVFQDLSTAQTSFQDLKKIESL